MNKEFYKEQVEELMKSSLDARMVVYYLEAIITAAKHDFIISSMDYLEIRTYVLGQIDQMYNCNPGLHYILNREEAVA